MILYIVNQLLNFERNFSSKKLNLIPTGIRSRMIQPVVSRYTDWATGPTNLGDSRREIKEEMKDNIKGKAISLHAV